MTMANGGVIQLHNHRHAPHSAKLSNKAQHTYILDKLKTRSSITIGQLFNNYCIAISSRFNVKILENNKIIITGRRINNGLRDPPSHPIQKNHHIILRNHYVPKKLHTKHNNTTLMEFFGPKVLEKT